MLVTNLVFAFSAASTSCGRTLLDTINNLLDVTFIDKYQKTPFCQSGSSGEKRSTHGRITEDVSCA
jgi:hypothetical protein